MRAVVQLCARLLSLCWADGTRLHGVKLRLSRKEKRGELGWDHGCGTLCPAPLPETPPPGPAGAPELVRCKVQSLTGRRRRRRWRGGSREDQPALFPPSIRWLLNTSSEFSFGAVVAPDVRVSPGRVAVHWHPAEVPNAGHECGVVR